MATNANQVLDEITVTASRVTDYKVKLTRAASANLPSNQIERVVWDATPEFSESRQVMYKNIEPVHAPGAIYQYGSTGSRTFSIEGKFISRSVNEATRTLAYIQYLRTWAMPVFGTAGTAVGEDILGAPPSVLFLTAYARNNPGDNQTSKTVPIGNGSSSSTPAIGNNIYNVPVVITGLNIPYPSDVDYIPTINNIPVPTIIQVSVQLVETHSPNAYLNFNIQDFKQGSLINF
jgi:hypothetical protein